MASRKDRSILRVTAELGLSILSEWTAFIGVLTYAYERGGARSTGLASLALLSSHLVGAPVVAWLLHRHRALRVRRIAFAIEAGLLLLAASVALANGSIIVVAGATALSIGCFDSVRPTGAMLLPWVARSTTDLVRGNLWSSYSEAVGPLGGALLASALVKAGGGGAALLGCASVTLVALTSSLTMRGPGPDPDHHDSTDRGALRAVAHSVRHRPWTAAILAVSFARTVVVGAFDVILVVMAFRVLHLGTAGPGLLTAVIGGGSLASTVVLTAVARHRNLGPVLIGGLVVAATTCALLAATHRLPPVYLALAVIGLSTSLIGNAAQILLQRSVNPTLLGPMFAGLEFVSGVGELVGSAIAQTFIATLGVTAAIFAVGVALALVALATARSLRTADRRADVPVVEMSQLRRVALFAAMPPITLEWVAREAETMTVVAGTTLIAEGDVGDAFYVVVDGSFAVSMNGDPVRTLHPGDGAGEVALLTDVPRTATVVAVEPSEVLVVRRGTFLAAVTGHQGAFDAARTLVEQRRFVGGSAPSITAAGSVERAPDQ